MILEIGVVVLGLGLVFSIAILLVIVGFIYKHLDRKVAEKFDELADKNKELRSSITKVNEARVSDSKDMRKTLDSIEQKLDVLLKPDGAEKELEKEKVRVQAKK